MAESWHYKLMGEEIGPISSQQLKELAQNGTIDFDTPLRKSSSDSWNRASKVRGLFDGPNDAPQDSAHEDHAEPNSAPSPPSPPDIETSTTSPSDHPNPPSITKFQGNVIICLLMMAMGVPFLSAFRPAPKWEYTIESPNDILFDSEMEALGNAGWELVFARRASGTLGPSYEMILRRPK